MSHHDPQLKTYAENGLRAATDWLAHGREVEDGAVPRVQTEHRVPVALYSRDQTHAKRSSRRGGTGAAAGAGATGAAGMH